MSWDGINPVIDVKDSMHCNIPWPRWDGSLGGVEYYSAYRLWHLLQYLFHPNSWQKPVAITTVYSVPDDGCKGHPKHVELLTPNKAHNKKLHLVGIYMISITKMHGPMNIKFI